MSHQVLFDGKMKMQSTGLPRVCVASSGLGHVARGIEAWAEDMGRALLRRGVDVSLCKGGGSDSEEYERRLWCLQRESAQTKRILSLTRGRLLWKFGLGTPYGIEQSSFSWSLIRHLRRTGAEILHVQDPLLALRMQQARALGLVRTKTILGHGTEEPPEFLKKIEFLQHLAPWHAESARNAGVWRDTWMTIPNFVDTDLFHPGRNDDLRRELGIPADALVVLTVAAIKRHHKRIDYLLREFHALRQSHPELPVWLVIAGGWETETDALIAEGTALLGDRVKFLVRYPRQKIADLYRAADVFVLASLFEMMPIALIEAQASGLPCLVHEHPNLKWAIGAGGEAVNLAVEQTLANRLQELLASSDRRQSLAEFARRHCLDEFSEEVVVSQILAAYDRIRGESTRVVCGVGRQ